jgi:putative chitinase
MNNIISKEKFESVFKQAKIDYDYLYSCCLNNGIDNLIRLAAFLAQCGHESNLYTTFIESFKYKAERLVEVFPNYFKTLNEAKLYIGKEQDIANKVYANRLGNGTTDSGDGWKYRGRGLIQLTGSRNYRLYANYKNIDIDKVTSFLETKEGIIDSAIWFWNSNNLNNYCSSIVLGDTLYTEFRSLTLKINSKALGLEKRLTYYLQLID